MNTYTKSINTVASLGRQVLIIIKQSLSVLTLIIFYSCQCQDNVNVIYKKQNWVNKKEQYMMYKYINFVCIGID